jgi:tripartite-type tricarboxylate transporter receptor subunit TctC
MTLFRRQFLHFATGALALPAVTRIARAQSYPSRPVHLIVGFAAGGAADITARIIGQWLSERLGQSFVVENRPGAATNIATEAVAHAPADGYTLLMISSPHAFNATLYDKLNHNFVRDIAPVAGISQVPSVLEVNPTFQARTVPEFVAMSLAKSAGEPGVGVLPRSASRPLIFGSARPALISLLSLSIISEGVSFGPPMPLQALAS